MLKAHVERKQHGQTPSYQLKQKEKEIEQEKIARNKTQNDYDWRKLMARKQGHMKENYSQ